MFRGNPGSGPPAPPPRLLNRSVQGDLSKNPISERHGQSDARRVGEDVPDLDVAAERERLVNLVRAAPEQARENQEDGRLAPAPAFAEARGADREKARDEEVDGVLDLVLLEKPGPEDGQCVRRLRREEELIAKEKGHGRPEKETSPGRHAPPRAFFSILPHVSRSETDRLKTRPEGPLSGSTVK